MLSNHHQHLTLSALPENLHRFQSDRFPDNLLGAALYDGPGLLNGNDEHLAEYWLNEKERGQLDRYTFEKRRREWFMGRICAKQSVIDLLGKECAESLLPSDISIDVSPSGRPILSLPETTSLDLPDISISHSHDRV
ncbi:MAG: hypothetical protein P8X39_01055, partial [Desulfofustis sp.]